MFRGQGLGVQRSSEKCAWALWLLKTCKALLREVDRLLDGQPLSGRKIPHVGGTCGSKSSNISLTAESTSDHPSVLELWVSTSAWSVRRLGFRCGHTHTFEAKDLFLYTHPF